MNLGDFTVVGLTETSITFQQVRDGEQPSAMPLMAGGFQQTLPATIEQTRELSISQVVTLSLVPKEATL